MAHWDNKAFDKHADEIVGAWAAACDQNGPALDTLVEKTARDSALNPEQIRRLCRVVNSRAFNAVFEKKAGQPNRVPDFPVAKEDAVITRLHAEAAAVEKTAADASYPALDDELRAVRGDDVAPLFPKTAQVDREQTRELALMFPPDPPATERLLHLQKVAEELRGRVAFAGYEARTALDKLAARQKTIGYDVDAFEKDALALCGAPGLDVINTLRTWRGTPRVSVPTEKVAALLDRIVGRSTADARLAKTACDARARETASSAALTAAETEIVALKREVFGA